MPHETLQKYEEAWKVAVLAASNMTGDERVLRNKPDASGEFLPTSYAWNDCLERIVRGKLMTLSIR